MTQLKRLVGRGAARVVSWSSTDMQVARQSDGSFDSLGPVRGEEGGGVVAKGFPSKVRPDRTDDDCPGYTGQPVVDIITAQR